MGDRGDPFVRTGSVEVILIEVVAGIPRKEFSFQKGSVSSSSISLSSEVNRRWERSADAPSTSNSTLGALPPSRLPGGNSGADSFEMTGGAR
jgi:hypothetical protein